MIRFAPIYDPALERYFTSTYLVEHSDALVAKRINSMRCPHCGIHDIKKAINSFYGFCKGCSHKHYFFYPTVMQNLAAMSQNTVKFFIGGFNSGKTTIGCMLLARHIDEVPGATIAVVGVSKLKIKEVFMAIFTQFFAEHEYTASEKGTVFEFTYPNLPGVITTMTFIANEPQKIRSANLSWLHIIEANLVNEQIYTEGLARIVGRSQASKVLLKDKDGNDIMWKDPSGNLKEKVILNKQCMWLECNPDTNWVRKRMLESAVILWTPNVLGTDYYRDNALPAQLKQLGSINTGKVSFTDQVTFLNAPNDNPGADWEFIEQTSAAMTEAERNQLLYTDMSMKDGLVHPYFEKCFVEYEIWSKFNKNWIPNATSGYKWVEGYDKGGIASGSDKSAYILGAYNESTDTLIIVESWHVGSTLTEQDANKIIATRLKWGAVMDSADYYRGSWTGADSRIGSKERGDEENTVTAMARYRIHLSTKSGITNEIDTAVIRLNDMSKAGRIIIFKETNKDFITEWRQHVWDDSVASKKKSASLIRRSKRVTSGKNNDIMDALKLLSRGTSPGATYIPVNSPFREQDKEAIFKSMMDSNEDTLDDLEEAIEKLIH